MIKDFDNSSWHLETRHLFAQLMCLVVQPWLDGLDFVSGALLAIRGPASHYRRFVRSHLFGRPHWRHKVFEHGQT
ncbi:MAG: hypothetical protein IV107_21135 [Paucibacter sp.]|nr:hypothetical protein [Roseateles sp.]